MVTSLLYIYMAKPSVDEVSHFLGELPHHGIAITHLGKKDPPRKTQINVEDAAAIVLSGTDRTNYTFARSSSSKIDFDFQIRDDPSWPYSQISASSPDQAALAKFAGLAFDIFELFIAVRGIEGLGKDQNWEILHCAEKCPANLRSRILGS